MMFFLIQYARVIHAIRRFLSRTGMLDLLDLRARNTQWALWFRSLFSVLDFHDFITLETPWWTLASGRKVTDFLLQRPHARALEWGSGASTVWLGSLCRTVVSIESDRHWAEMVRGSVGPHVAILSPEVPRHDGTGGIRSKRWGFRKRDFSDYVNAGRSVAGPFDLIVIDGRAREACLEVALEQLAPDGIILFDNTNRLRYRRALARHREKLAIHRDVGLTPIVPWPTETSVISWKVPEAYAAAGSRAGVGASTER
ncbi:MAG: class I SAM-dependent methyltransferase [Pontimonas sp.]